MNGRIKKLRKSLDLTQQAFADRIGTTANVLTNYETGRRNPSSSVVNNICKTFNVNEAWLRAGEGEMFCQQTRDDELAAMVEQLMSGESSVFKKRLIAVLSTLKEDQWIFLEQKMREILEERSDPQTPEQEARAEAERYYQEVLQEKREAAGLSVLPDTEKTENELLQKGIV